MNATKDESHDAVAGQADCHVRRAGGVGDGWRLLKTGERLLPGDGFAHPSFDRWIDYDCRPDLFRGKGEHVHSGWAWRRRT